MLFTNILGLRDCKNLQEVVIRKSGEGILNNLAFIDLPKLKQIDLSFVKGLQDLMLLRLPNCKITYPATLKYYYDGGANELVDLSETNTISLTLSEDVYKKDETKAFITNLWHHRCGDLTLITNINTINTLGMVMMFGVNTIPIIGNKQF